MRLTRKYRELQKDAWKKRHTFMLIIGSIALGLGSAEYLGSEFSGTVWVGEIVVLAILLIILSKIGKKRHDKKFEARQRRQIQRIEKEVDEFVAEHQYELMIVPPKYASSVKLSYAYDFYAQGQADNMKEALTLADTKNYRQNELMYLQFAGSCVCNLVSKVEGIDAGYWWPSVEEISA